MQCTGQDCLMNMMASYAVDLAALFLWEQEINTSLACEEETFELVIGLLCSERFVQTFTANVPGRMHRLVTESTSNEQRCIYDIFDASDEHGGAPTMGSIGFWYAEQVIWLFRDRGDILRGV